MRRYKGELEVELADVNSGETELVSETNMVTNAVNDLLGMNPMGLFFKTSGEYDQMMNWNDEMLPICPNMIGGIMLFPASLDEGADNVYPPGNNLPVAYASNDVNASGNLKRGSMNLTESTALNDGYKFVWEFTPSQGNGTIAAIGLTSKHGGENVYGSDAAVDTSLLLLRKNEMQLSNDLANALLQAIDVDFEKGLLYSFFFEGSSVKVSRYRIPIFDVGLNEKLDDTTITLEDTTALACSEFAFKGGYTLYGIFLDGFDGYWYGFANEASYYSDTEMKYIKIRKSDLSYSEGTWTLSNAKLREVGSIREGSGYYNTERNAVIRGGYLYALGIDNMGVYKINLANHTDVSFIRFGFESRLESMAASGNCVARLLLLGDVIIGYDFIIDGNDNVIQTSGGARFDNMATPLFKYKEFVLGWGGSYSNKYRYNFLLTPYLATICNLSSVVVKNADKTMKITYTLTEEVVPE